MPPSCAVFSCQIDARELYNFLVFNILGVSEITYSAIQGNKEGRERHIFDDARVKDICSQVHVDGIMGQSILNLKRCVVPRKKEYSHIYSVDLSPAF